MTQGLPLYVAVTLIVAGPATLLTYWAAVSLGTRRAALKGREGAGIRNWLGAVLLAWGVAAFALSYAGAFEPTWQGIPFSWFMAFGVVTVGLVALLIPAYRRAVAAIPQTVLIGAHAFRFVGFIMLPIAAQGFIPAPLRSAGIGDMLVAAGALVAVYMLWRRLPYARPGAIVWNLLGVTDMALGFVNLAQNPAPITNQFPFVLLFATLAPVLLLFHAYSLGGLLRGRGIERSGVTGKSNPTAMA
jgi:hypothetical protein